MSTQQAIYMDFNAKLFNINSFVTESLYFPSPYHNWNKKNQMGRQNQKKKKEKIYKILLA